jgi:hypothetical protein
MPSRRRRAKAWHTADTVDLEIAALVAQRFGQGRLHVADGQAAHERGDHQRLQRIGLGDVRAEQPGGELLRRAAQLGPGQGDGSGSGLDGHLPVSVAGPDPMLSEEPLSA